MELRNAWDVVVVGAGPGGVATAAAFADRGASVLLTEAAPGAAQRLAGEWLHPPAVDFLRTLELVPVEAVAGHAAGRGFVVHPDDGGDPIRLPYAGNERGISLPHDRLVEGMRERVRDRGGIRYLEGARVGSVSPEGVVELSWRGSTRTLYAEKVVGADGKGSNVRRQLVGGALPPAVSHMAGVLLRDVELPVEGYGHLFLGGPGPALAYRIGPGAVRLCMDLPSGTAPRTAAGLWAGFGPLLPEPMRAALRDALETAPIAWAALRMMPRSYYGSERVHLLGDAVGTVHPLCAQGITLALGDALAVAEARDGHAYMRRREAESWVAELLSQALYEVVVRPDAAATEVRHAMFRTWRASGFERERTMALLAGRLTGRASFGSAFLHVALRAGQASAQKGMRRGLGATARGLAGVASFHVYPVRALSPGLVRRRRRADWTLEMPHASAGARDADRARREDPALPPSLAEEGPLAEATAALRGALAGTDAEAVARAISHLVERCEVRARHAAERLAVARLLRDAVTRWPGIDAGRAEAWLAEQGARVRRRREGAPEATGRVELAQDLELLCLSGACAGDAMVRGLAARLATVPAPEGASGPGRVIESAAVLVALLRAGSSDETALARMAAFLEATPGLGPDDEAERRLALALFAERRAGELASETNSGRARADEADVARCVEHLERVSRSFARPIAALSDPLRTAVMCGYLLCRIADTLEDAPGASGVVREEHLRCFLEVLEGGRGPGSFVEAALSLEATPDEAALLGDTGRVLTLLASVPAPMRAVVKRWAAEMARGMIVYVRRPADVDGLSAPLTVRDLERYCYFVAGTVGHMLTDLFVLHLPDLPSAQVAGLRGNAEAFGIGLQLVNVLKDITDDHARGVAYVPAELALARGVRISELTDPALRGRAHETVGPLFELAKAHLDGALAYVRTLPPSAVELRAFCLLPLWMAVRTLVHARGNDAMFQPGVPVKIERDEVDALASDCLARLGSDRDLEQGYALLWERSPEPPTRRHASRPRPRAL